jgi:hypothetical protein
VPVELAFGFEGFSAYFADQFTGSIPRIGSSGSGGVLGRCGVLTTSKIQSF